MTLTKNEHGYYEVKIKDQSGRVKSFSTHQKNKDEAKRVVKDAHLEEIERAAELNLLTQSVVSVLVAGKRMSIEDVIEPWKEALGREHRSPMFIAGSVGWIEAWVEQMRLSKRQLVSITEDDIDPWINLKTGSQTKAGTRGVKLSAIRSLLRFAGNKGWIHGNPANLVHVDYGQMLHSQKETHKQPCFTNEEVSQLIARTGPTGLKPSPFWHAAVPLSRCIGLRLVDVAALEWDSVQSDGSIICWTRKRDKRVQPPVLHPEWMGAALESVERRSSRYLFPTERSIILDPKVRSTLSTQFSRICKGLDIWGKSFHGLRASYVTEMAAAGIPLEEISMAVGHSNGATTEGYIRPDA